MTEATVVQDRIYRWGRRAVAVGALAGIACAVGWWLAPERFLRSLHVAWLFWLSLSLGCAALAMIQHLVTGRWTVPLRRILESAAWTLPLWGLAALPLAFGLPRIFPWIGSHGHAGGHATWEGYLNVPFFAARAVGYFLLWGVLIVGLVRESRKQDLHPEGPHTARLRLWSGPGLILLAVTGSLAAVDWIMSLEPGWSSNVYGLHFLSGALVTAMAFAVLVAAVLGDGPPLERLVADRAADLGNLLMAFLLIWAYLSFSQYLIVWSGNLPEETPWYIHRNRGGWQAFPPILAVFHFAVPFLVLVGGEAKKDRRILGAVAAWIFVFRGADHFWQVAPAFSPDRLSLHVLDAAAFAFLGGLWIAAFCARLRTVPLLPLQDPRFEPERIHG